MNLLKVRYILTSELLNLTLSMVKELYSLRRRIVIFLGSVRRSAILIERRHVQNVRLYFHVLISSIGQSEARIVVGRSLLMSKNLRCLNVRGCRYRPTIIIIIYYCTTCVHERNICS